MWEVLVIKMKGENKMYMKDTVSIIVPVYNTEKYLKQCIDSICNQTYSNIDIILITEKCDDRSEQICDELAQQDSRIRVVHKGKVSGVSKSRNIGLEMAKGEYILFVDSDDYIYPDRVERLLKELQDSKADIIVGGKTILEDGVFKPEIVNAPVGTVQDFPDAFKYVLGKPYENRFIGYVWVFMIPIDMIKQSDGTFIHFKESLNYSEDVHWIVRVLMNCRNIYFSECISYVYRRYREGNTRDLMYNAKTLKYADSAIHAYTDIYRFLIKHNLSDASCAYYRIIMHKVRAVKTAKVLKDAKAKKKYSHNIIRMIGHYVLLEHSLIALIWAVKIMFIYFRDQFL